MVAQLVLAGHGEFVPTVDASCDRATAIASQNLEDLGYMIPGSEIVIGYLSLECQLGLLGSVEALTDVVVVPAEPGMPSPKRELLVVVATGAYLQPRAAKHQHCTPARARAC